MRRAGRRSTSDTTAEARASGIPRPVGELAAVGREGDEAAGCERALEQVQEALPSPWRQMREQGSAPDQLVGGVDLDRVRVLVAVDRRGAEGGDAEVDPIVVD